MDTPTFSFPTNHDWSKPYVDRNLTLSEMGFASYADYLASDLWQQIRRQVLMKYPLCYICSQNTATVVHHMTYHKTVLDATRLSGLISLCRDCNHRIEFGAKGHKRSLKQANRRLKALYRENHPKLGKYGLVMIGQLNRARQR